MGSVFYSRLLFEFHLAHWASNPQILLARGTSPVAQVFKLINPRFASLLEGVVPNSPRSNYFLTLNATLKTHMKYMMNFTFYFPS